MEPSFDVNDHIQFPLINNSDTPSERVEETMEFQANIESRNNLSPSISSPPDNEISPPATPPSPPGPVAPAAPLWTQQDFNFTVNRIQNHLDQIEKIVIGPHIILIEGIQNLRRHTGSTWRDRVHQLLYEARIPYFWVLHCVPDDDDNVNEEINNDQDENDDEYSDHIPTTNCPHRIRMYLISHHVKSKVYHMLKSFLKNEYNNIVHMD